MTHQELDDFRTEADILMYLIPHLMNRVKREVLSERIISFST